MTSLVHQIRRGFAFWEYLPWSQKHVSHGFTGIEENFHQESFRNSAQKLTEAFGVSVLLCPHQVHECDIWDFREAQILARMLSLPPEKRPTADAIIVDTRHAANIALGIRTADCVPLLVRQGPYMALIHAGWRGLAGGIIQKVLWLMNEVEEVFIGPCAGPSRYEVGFEVVEAIGTSAVYEKKGEKYLLDLPCTARSQVREVCEDASIVFSGICTISSPEFHSHRRDGSKSGRNLSFVIVG